MASSFPKRGARRGLSGSPTCPDRVGDRAGDRVGTFTVHPIDARMPQPPPRQRPAAPGSDGRHSAVFLPEFNGTASLTPATRRPSPDPDDAVAPSRRAGGGRGPHVVIGSDD